MHAIAHAHTRTHRCTARNRMHQQRNMCSNTWPSFSQLMPLECHTHQLKESGRILQVAPAAQLGDQLRQGTYVFREDDRHLWCYALPTALSQKHSSAMSQMQCLLLLDGYPLMGRITLPKQNTEILQVYNISQEYRKRTVSTALFLEHECVKNKMYSNKAHRQVSGLLQQPGS